MPLDLSIVDKMFKSLLEHYWSAHDNKLPPLAMLAPKGYLISYGTLVDREMVPIDPRNAGGYLHDVAEVCAQVDWPPLHSLVVNKDLGRPGDGFLTAPPYSLAHPGTWQSWELDVTKCITSSSRIKRQIPNH